MWQNIVSFVRGVLGTDKQPVINVHVNVDLDDDQPQMLTEAPANHKALSKMTKAELDAFGEQHGIKLDRRKTKAHMLAVLEENGFKD